MTILRQLTKMLYLLIQLDDSKISSLPVRCFEQFDA